LGVWGGEENGSEEEFAGQTRGFEARASSHGRQSLVGSVVTVVKCLNRVIDGGRGVNEKKGLRRKAWLWLREEFLAKPWTGLSLRGCGRVS
jgi:hypothetical protein